MPQLKQLEAFQASFKQIGSKSDTLSKQEDIFEDIELPETEPPVPFPEGLDNTSIEPAPDTGFPDLGDLGLDLPPESFANTDIPPPPPEEQPPENEPLGASDFDFGDLLNDIPGGLDLPPVPEPPPIPEEPESSPDFPEPEPSPVPEEPEFSPAFPESDTSSVTEEPESAPVTGESEPFPDGMDSLTDLFSGGAETTPESAPDTTDFSDSAFGDIDLSQALDMGGEIGDISAQDTDQAIDTTDGGLPAPDFDEGIDLSNSFDLGGEAQEGGFHVPETTASGTGEDFPGGSGGEIAGEDFSGGSGEDFSGMDLSGMDFSGSADEDFSGTDFSGADTAGGAEMPDSGFGGTAAGDTGTDFNIDDLSTSDLDAAGLGDIGSGAGIPEDGTDGMAVTESSEPPAPAEPASDTPDSSKSKHAEEGFGDFALAGFDDALTAQGKAKAPGAAKPGVTASDDVEEINLSEEDYKRLLNTLLAYPLNLRIACEELIAEQAVAPEQMSALIKLLVRGAPAKETAALAGKILGRTIAIPKGYAKQTGEDMEAEQSSFAYIFVHRFLPIIKIFGAITLVALSLAYLVWHFIITPIQAENLYKEGYAQLKSGEYTRANDLFSMGFEKHRVKNWFYRYAKEFCEERQYIFAERKYDELLRVYPRDKKGALDYAAMETNKLRNYEKADKIIRNNILDYTVNDPDGLYALAENNLAWGATDKSRYEDARAAYARLMELYGKKDLYLEGMLKYFIRTDKLSEVLPIHAYFMQDPKKRKITVPTLAELGAYLLDKRFEVTEGVPDEYADRIEGIRDVLLRGIKEDNKYPESYYHLARYYHYYGSVSEEKQTLKDAIRAFNNAPEESSQRAGFRIDAHRRLAEVMINSKEFFPAEEELLEAKRLYENALERQILKTEAIYGRIYADLGDLEYFTKDGDMNAALQLYLQGEQNLWSPPEIQYRMGAAHYQLEQWEDALLRFFPLVTAMPNNRRLLYALGNVSYQRGNYFAAQGYYNRLMDMLDTQRLRFPNLTPDSRPEEQELIERIMVSENNLGVTLETLTRISGDTSYRSRALGLFADSIRAWDILTRDPDLMTRMRPLKDLYAPGINLAYLNVRAITLSEPNYDPQIYLRIDKDGLEPSPWEELISRDYRLSEQLLPMAVE